jgi:hypothetical protein
MRCLTVRTRETRPTFRAQYGHVVPLHVVTWLASRCYATWRHAVKCLVFLSLLLKVLIYMQIIDVNLYYAILICEVLKFPQHYAWYFIVDISLYSWTLLNTAETSRGLDIKLADLELWGTQFNTGSGFSATLNWTSGVLIIQWINVKPLKNSWLVTLS